MESGVDSAVRHRTLVNVLSTIIKSEHSGCILRFPSFEKNLVHIFSGLPIMCTYLHYDDTSGDCF